MKRHPRFARETFWPAIVLSLVGIWAGGRAAAQSDAPTPTAAPAGSETLPMSRAIPADVMAYVEWEGVGGDHQANWRKTTLYRTLFETRLNKLLDDLLTDATKKMAQSQPGVQPDQVRTVIKHVFEHGCAFAVVGLDPLAPKKGTAILVLPGAAEPQVRAALAALLGAGAKSTAKKPKLVKQGNRTVVSQGDDTIWWLEGNDLIVSANAADSQRVFDTLDGKQPNLGQNPAFQKLHKAKNFDVVGIAWIDAAALIKMDQASSPEAGAGLKTLGVDTLKTFSAQWGLAGAGIQTVIRADLPAPRTGLMKLVDQPSFSLDDLPPLPARSVSWGVYSVNWVAFYDDLVKLGHDFESRARPAGATGSPTDMVVGLMNSSLGFNLRDEVLTHLGTKVAFAFSTGEGESAGSRSAGSSALTLMIEAKNPQALQKTLVKAMQRAEKAVNGTEEKETVARERGQRAPGGRGTARSRRGFGGRGRPGGTPNAQAQANPAGQPPRGYPGMPGMAGGMPNMPGMAGGMPGMPGGMPGMPGGMANMPGARPPGAMPGQNSLAQAPAGRIRLIHHRNKGGIPDSWTIEIPPGLFTPPAGATPSNPLMAAGGQPVKFSFGIAGQYLTLGSTLEQVIDTLRRQNNSDLAWKPNADFRNSLRHVQLAGGFNSILVNDPRPGVTSVLKGMPVLMPLLQKLGLKIEAGDVPRPAAITALLFPSIMVTSVTDQGVELVSYSAFPGAESVAAPAVLVALIAPAAKKAAEVEGKNKGPAGVAGALGSLPGMMGGMPAAQAKPGAPGGMPGMPGGMPGMPSGMPGGMPGMPGGMYGPPPGYGPPGGAAKQPGSGAPATAPYGPPGGAAKQPGGGAPGKS